MWTKMDACFVLFSWKFAHNFLLLPMLHLIDMNRHGSETQEMIFLSSFSILLWIHIKVIVCVFALLRVLTFWFPKRFLHSDLELGNRGQRILPLRLSIIMDWCLISHIHLSFLLYVISLSYSPKVGFILAFNKGIIIKSFFLVFVPLCLNNNVLILIFLPLRYIGFSLLRCFVHAPPAATNNSFFLSSFSEPLCINIKVFKFIFSSLLYITSSLPRGLLRTLRFFLRFSLYCSVSIMEFSLLSLLHYVT